MEAGENYRKAQDAIDEKSGDQSTKSSNRQPEKNSLATEETVKYSNRENFFPGNVFPSGKTHTDAFEWARRKDVKTGDKRLMLYRGTYYRVEKFDDMDFMYLITKKFDAQDYNEELNEYGEIDSEEPVQERVDRIDALYRGPDEYGQGRYYADSPGTEHRGEDLPILSVDQDTTEGREDYSRTERDRQGGLRDQRQTGRETLERTPQELYDKIQDLDSKLIYATGSYATRLKNQRERYASMIDDRNGWDQVRLSDRDTESVSNRSLLANAFEGIITNPIEKKKLQEYKELVAFTGGNLTVNDEDGVFEARAYICGNRVCIRADHPDFSVMQLLKHKIGHHKIRKGNVDMKKVYDAIVDVASEEYVQYVIESYVAAYESLKGYDADYILEEILCDYEAGMNIFSKENVPDSFWEMSQDILESDTVKQRSVRGPPADVVFSRSGRGRS